MKRNAFILVALMVFSFGLANAQDVLDITGPPTGSWNGGANVDINKPITWTVHWTNNLDIVTAHSNGFQVFLSDSPTGYPQDNAGTFQAITYAAIYDFGANGDDGGFFFNPFSVDGVGADTIGFGGFAIFGGIPIGTDVDAYTITTQLDATYDADPATKWLCLDSCFYPPGGAWLWATKTSGSIQPNWSGPYCYAITSQPNQPAEFTNAPAVTQNADHCAVYTFNFDGVDPDPGQCNPPGTGDVVFSIVSTGGLNGTANIDANGVFSYQWVAADGMNCYDVTVHVEDMCGAGSDTTFQLCFTNVAPTISAGCGDTTKVGMGNPISFSVTGTSNDCDAVSYYIAGVNPAPTGTYNINPTTGEVTFNTAIADGGTVYTFTIGITDGVDNAECDAYVDVLTVEPFGIQIEKTHGTFQGVHENVDVFQTKGSNVMGGFDFLIAYDASALSFQTAVVGDLYSKCKWEYFTFRYGPNGNCSGGCPSGMLRVVGIAETNNGANHPVADCKLDPNETMFTLDFLVSDNRTYECQYVPIRFFWMDCGDNTISNQGGDTLWISSNVFDFEGNEITDMNYGFPTYFGAQSECLIGGGPNKPVPIQLIEFTNGGIDIACADSIDARGDLNLNGVSYEIADAVLYSNYFVHGIGVLNINYQGQVAASDVNADGIPLSVGDLVYMIRVVVGDALPYPKLAPVDANVTFGSELAVDQKMGAAYVVIDGQAAPELLADNMEMKYAYDANENITRVLVYSMEANQTFEGAFLAPNGNVVSIEMATYEGAPVKIDMVPANYALYQNYPNPFNPTTTISFALANAGDYNLTVYNVAGQEVSSFSGTAEAGVVEIEFDASELASGVYFYKLEADAFSATKKMVLLK